MEHGAHIALSDCAADEMDYDLVGDIVKVGCFNVICDIHSQIFS
jgi:hypothetical protein